VSGTRVAVVGAGMTRFMRRAQETGKELAWEAARAALDSCQLTLADVDAVSQRAAGELSDERQQAERGDGQKTLVPAGTRHAGMIDERGRLAVMRGPSTRVPGSVCSVRCQTPKSVKPEE